MKQLWLYGFIMMSLLSGPAYGMELCSMMGGKCQNTCTADQYAESGVFEDCRNDQECCVDKTPSVSDRKASAGQGKKESGPVDPVVQPERAPVR